MLIVTAGRNLNECEMTEIFHDFFMYSDFQMNVLCDLSVLAKYCKL